MRIDYLLRAIKALDDARGFYFNIVGDTYVIRDFIPHPK